MERQVLLAPDVVASTAALAVRDREQRWMLRQDRAVRRSYAEEVLGRPDEERRAMAWMLRQPADVRRSYAHEVLADRDDPEAREQRWMLLQDDAVVDSYRREVLGEPG